MEIMMDKKSKSEIKLDSKNKKESQKSRKIYKRVMTFDVYFQVLMKKDKSIMLHHKAPMRNYAESRGAKEATEEEFDRIFRIY